MSNKPHVLIVEDEAPKSKHIESLVAGIAPHARMTLTRSVNSALDVLEAGQVDLLLLDMSLPTFDVGEREAGGRPQGFGGTEVLRHMAMAEISCPTVVITGYEGFAREGGVIVDLAKLREELSEEFPNILHAVLHYNSTLDEWKTVLTATIRDTGISGLAS